MTFPEKPSRAENAGSVFNEKEFEACYPQGIDSYWWHLARNSVILDVIDKYLDRESPILDVGCGRGIAVKYLREQGIDCTGVEPAPAPPLAEVASHVHAEIWAQELPPAMRERYRTILLLDVLEHLPEPASFLCEIQSAFPGVTHVVLTVPARPELWSNYDDFYGHYRRYKPALLDDLAASVEATVVYRSYFFRLLYLPAWLYAVTGTERRVDVSPPSPGFGWIHRILARLSLLDYRILPKQVPGVSLISCLRLKGTGTS